MAPSTIKTDTKSPREKASTRTSLSVPQAEPPEIPGALATDELQSQVNTPGTSEIALLAYSYWEERMRNDQPGSAEDDWFRAEKHLAK